ncbi:DNA polymerase epsilon subunit D, putative, partial [Candida maltosa Xu316]
MPPKGWRKNAEGQYPQPSSKENELISIDDILFPRSTIQKLAKNIISDDENSANHMTIAKDSLLALQRSATVFVSHLFFQAKEVSKESNRKTVSAQDILTALEKAEFSGFIPEVKQKLAQFEADVAKKKKQPKTATTTTTTTEEESIGSETKRLKIDERTGTSAVKHNNKESNKENGDDDTEEEQEGDGDDEEDEDEDDDEEGDVTKEEDEDEDEEMEEEEDVSINPISALAKEEEELQGTETEEKISSSTDDEEEDDDEQGNNST